MTSKMDWLSEESAGLADTWKDLVNYHGLDEQTIEIGVSEEVGGLLGEMKHVTMFDDAQNASVPSISFGDNDSGLYESSSNQLNIKAGGVNEWQAEPNGVTLDSTGLGVTIDSSGTTGMGSDFVDDRTSGILITGGDQFTTGNPYFDSPYLYPITAPGTFDYPNTVPLFEDPMQAPIQPEYTFILGTTANDKQPKYVVFELPRAEMPNKVFVCGRLVSLGILGEDVVAAWDKDDKLVMDPSELNALYVNRMEISLEYDDCMFYYKIAIDDSLYGQVKAKLVAGSNILEATLVSEVTQ